MSLCVSPPACLAVCLWSPQSFRSSIHKYSSGHQTNSYRASSLIKQCFDVEANSRISREDFASVVSGQRAALCCPNAGSPQDATRELEHKTGHVVPLRAVEKSLRSVNQGGDPEANCQASAHTQYACKIQDRSSHLVGSAAHQRSGSK